MNTIFDALNPGNQNDVFDCCNGNLKCKENEFAKKCVSGTSGRTFSFNLPELTCDIPIENRRFIFSAGETFTNFINFQTPLLIQSIKINDFTAFELTIPPLMFISIFDTSDGSTLFNNSPAQFEVPYSTALSRFTAAPAGFGSGTIIKFIQFINTGLPQQALKLINRNFAKNKIMPHAEQTYSIASVNATTLTADKLIPTPCGEPVETVTTILIYEVQAAI
jgi:hypothetical protein